MNSKKDTGPQKQIQRRRKNQSKSALTYLKELNQKDKHATDNNYKFQVQM